MIRMCLHFAKGASSIRSESWLDYTDTADGGRGSIASLTIKPTRPTHLHMQPVLIIGDRQVLSYQPLLQL
jgi:hypothetical protein